MANEPLQQGPYPASSNAFTVDTDIKAVVQWAASKSVMTFTSAAARTSAFTAAGISPAAGMICYRADAPGLNRFEAYDPTSGSWRVFGPYRDAAVCTVTTASVTFSAIPRTLSTIRLAVRARSTASALATNLQAQIGGDTTSNYISLYRFNANSGSSTDLGGVAATSMVLGYLPAASTGSSRFAALDVTFTGWDATAIVLPCRHQGGYVDSSSNYVISHGIAEYTGSNAWTSITLFPLAGSFTAGTELTLEGI